MKIGDIFNPYKLFTGLFIPNVVARYAGISEGAKLCLGRLHQYAGADGVCFPSQKALAEEIGVPERKIRRLLTELIREKFIAVHRPAGINRLTHQTNRYVFLWHAIYGPSGADTSVLSGKDTGVRSYIRCSKRINSKENQKRGGQTKKPFVPPTLVEVQSYCLERQNKIDPQRFLDYYESNGWKVGRNPMKDWKAAVRTWERRDKEGYGKQQKAERIRPEPGKYDGIGQVVNV